MSIPKVFHAIWLGDKPMPKRWAACWWTWVKEHPSWATRLWTDADDLGFLPPETRRCYDVARRDEPDIRYRVDILRYSILREHGGVYVDVDFECLKPIDTLLDEVNGSPGAFTASEGHDMLSIGIMGCERNHPTFLAIEAALPESFATRTGIGERTSPGFFTRTVRSQQLAITVFPPALFYPYSGEDARNSIPFDPASAPDAYAVHHWSSIIHSSLIW